MKNSLALFTSLIIILSGCAKEVNSPTFSEIQPVQQVETYTAADYEAANTAETNKESISAVVETIFAQNFADDLDIPAVNKVTTISKNLQQKGGMVFNLLNKSKLAQKV